MAGQPKKRADLLKLDEIGAQQVEDVLATGINIDDAWRPLGVSRGALREWLERPEHSAVLTRARARAADKLASEALTIADEQYQRVVDPETGEERLAAKDVARDRLRIDTRKWLASKWNQQQYGDQKGVQVQINLGSLHLRAVKDIKPEVIEHDDITDPNDL